MNSENNISNRYDVLVVGFGPAGAVAAGMLGARGHSTLVVDRLTDIYDKPRAIAIDHEILRHFDNMGIADEVLRHTAPFTASQHFGAQGQLIRRIDMVPAPYPLGYTPSMVFTQPPVEAILRRHAESFDCVAVELGTEMVGLDQRVEEAVATLKDASGNIRTVTAKYVIGCDGASSRVRELSGMRLEDLLFDEPWLVVDVQVHDPTLAKLPQTSAQFCDPSRPTSYIMGPKNHRRWEIMLLPDENPREMEKPENVWRLLSPWLTSEEGELWRAAAYRFHALVADEWRRGRVLIAGDAAHQQPPFIGQGMCQGLRDVSNLVWRLDRVLKEQSSEALLDTYTVERKRHVQTLTGKIKAIGQMICERNPAAAAARDARILAEGDGKPLTITRQEIVPPIEEGLLAADGTPARGLLFPQPAIVEGASTRLLDRFTGPNWRLILDGRRIGAGEGEALVGGIDGIVIKAVAPEGAEAVDPAALREKDGVLSAWFDRHGTVAALVRPDHYVFGAAQNVQALRQQIADLHARLA
ncbi:MULTISPECIES: bifunctional 3-(3-hydroxy-phenyl)propionate/3-hydroxycinnamic acid hydroxylase [Rhizobium]|uniref:bifunctional 3-(3-hydroxy-phenyl)propionate/3-hydroxycinnamic acid hydroxylase n=1 Tax=Rhizobium TaxID=379 RepID=UPI000523077E|nr:MULTISPECIES: bifunctional 3-(3-hydroxy-phenyl)propionate/3-hydroxycinnamic acid hydroxylase [Rhizobium]QJX08371.1 bifunctional 3-(3-hydroxy-phenyl)propionate/3-hydroxycinnamic acid hydroxylase [Rhizobium brockwellii]TAX27431.1 bifunctional 3-(3-hydroxy-phenyl)propionate/3-hydroxycinnamic acid hydroxylase [Rhizobium leguminosarum]TAX87508.1 bifunctional 3-(3-hydroxy-phenyl)propionate/3-hydroxycinnamic acid hydroxylase [Rhizobium leguminosarum]TAY90952.1 bifunctional 3-(3-hydroxy-phenyl)propi